MKSIALLAALLTLTIDAAASVTETFTQTYPLAPEGAISLVNVNGDIDIVTWDKPEVSLEAVKRAKDNEALKQIEIVIDAQPSALSIKTKNAKKNGWSSSGRDISSVRYKLMVPAGTMLDKIDSVNSTITVTGAHGSIKLETVNGNIIATDLRADARLESVNGSIHAQFSALERVHTIRLESVNGGAEVTLPKGASASIKTSTVNGRSRVDQRIKLSRSGKHNLSGDIGGAIGPAISLETVNGNIAVREK
jgi:DUF4097 and DUF4098 domain-containing protein YvlB